MVVFGVGNIVIVKLFEKMFLVVGEVINLLWESGVLVEVFYFLLGDGVLGVEIVVYFFMVGVVFMGSMGVV